jgi:DNA-binding winged helix-turn-helix (wHTH) protein
MTSNSLPLTFRAAETDRIFKLICAGDSCLVIGIGSVGKSNLLRYLQQEDVRREKLGDDWKNYLFIYIDINKIVRLNKWGLFELMLRQLQIELTRQKIDVNVVREINLLHKEAVESSAKFMVLLKLDEALRIVCEDLHLRLVFMLDEFDALCPHLGARTFGTLRALRDDYKYQLMYIAASRMELDLLGQNQADIEPFEELITPNTLWLLSYPESDAKTMINRILTRRGIKLDENSINPLLKITGGHPGLLRASIEAFSQPTTDLVFALLKYPNVQKECLRIWFSIRPEEQDALIKLVNLNSLENIHERIKNSLRAKGLLVNTGLEGEHTFSILFEDYIRNTSPMVGARINLDSANHVVWVDDKKVDDLSPHCFRAIEFLVKQRNKAVKRDDLIRFVYMYGDPNADIGNITDQAISNVIKNLRKKIGDNPNNPTLIVAVRGFGFKLVGGPERENDQS